MAELDPRTLDLVRTLVGSKLDWLAFELIDALQAGDPVVETESDLDQIRQDIRTQKRPAPLSADVLRAAVFQLQGSSVKPLAGDDQVKWAADFVARRIETAVAELRGTLENLHTVLLHGRGHAVTKLPAGSAPEILLSSANVQFGLPQVLGAASALPSLRQALDAWVNDPQGQTSP